ncbi:MAG: hypothetical protein EGQ81_03055 [Akkermansia sp.]|nr:hypothetical protein [Akkermansia sp.]
MKQPGQFNCPKCGAPFSAADVDAVQDTVTCGSCGHAVPWNSLIRENESPAPLAAPPKHLTMQMEDGRITLTYRHSRFKVLLALGFALIWGLITLFLLWLSLGPAKTDFALPVFTTFFAVSEAFIIFICVDMLLGKVVVRAEPGRGALFRGIGPLGSTWTFLLPMQADVAVERPGGDGDKYRRISIPQPSGRPFYFSGGISEPDVLEYITLVLRRFRA